MKRSKELSQQELMQTRYPGSDVLGMEYTTALPVNMPTGAGPATLPIHPKLWPDALCHKSTTKGKP